MSKTKIPKLRNKDYQFTVRIPEKMRVTMIKRIEGIGMNALAEYVRHLIINDINGMDEYYGQGK